MRTMHVQMKSYPGTEKLANFVISLGMTCENYISDGVYYYIESNIEKQMQIIIRDIFLSKAKEIKRKNLNIISFSNRFTSTSGKVF